MKILACFLLMLPSCDRYIPPVEKGNIEITYDTVYNEYNLEFEILGHYGSNQQINR